MNPLGIFNSLLSPPSPHNGPMRGDYGMNSNPRSYVSSRPSPTNGLTPEQQMFIERYIKEKRLLNRSCNQMGIPLSPTMNMPMMQNHNEMLVQNMMNMCADWFPKNGHRSTDAFR